MKGKEKEAVALLRRALERALQERKLHEAYEIEMLLVEAFIYAVRYFFCLFIVVGAFSNFILFFIWIISFIDFF